MGGADGSRPVSLPRVVVATGLARVPRLPTWPGRESYRGELLHSAAYRNGAPWKGRRVLVIGMGNTGGEIALDLLEHGAAPTVSVRGPVNVIPRDVLGVSVLAVGALLRVLPSRVADLLSEPILRIESVTSASWVTRLPYGTLTQVNGHGRVPLIDSGTIAQIRAGKIALRGAIEAFTTEGVRFAGGQDEPFEAVIAATGFDHALAEMLTDAAQGCGPTGLRSSEPMTTHPGLYLCGSVFHERNVEPDPSRCAGDRARHRVARLVANRVRSRTSRPGEGPRGPAVPPILHRREPWRSFSGRCFPDLIDKPLFYLPFWLTDGRSAARGNSVGHAPGPTRACSC